MVWVAIFALVKSQLMFVKNNLNALRYTELLNNSPVPFIEDKNGGKYDEATFEHDGVPAHSALHTAMRSNILQYFIRVLY